METLSLLDVGHGNCAILKSATSAIVVDAASQHTLAATLDALGIEEIEALIVSHGDEDHVSGAASLLANLNRPVRHLFANPDVVRRTKAWRVFLAASGEAARNGTKVHSALTSVDPGELRLGRASVSVLFPFGDLALAGVEGTGARGEYLDANTMSGVIRICYDGRAFCLLAADMSQASLDLMLERNQDIAAPMLMFPHHGGLPRRADGEVFAKAVTSLVSPELVLFSLGRGVHATPRPEIIKGVRAALEGVTPYLACTQLSKRCAAVVPEKKSRAVKYSAGYKKNISCAGSLTFEMGVPIKSEIERLRLSHGAFIMEYVPGRICGLV
ncbi:MBL fold metallo-hydrolase [Xanthomonas sp. F4]|nr:MBL fold metallo-hydrolase [Xanthomonas sp. LMG 9002]